MYLGENCRWVPLGLFKIHGQCCTPYVKTKYPYCYALVSKVARYFEVTVF